MALCVTAHFSDAAARQADGRAAVSGAVVDRVDGRPIARAKVSLSPKTGGSIGPVLSDEHGRFSFEGLRANSYAVVVVAEGYRPGDQSQSNGVTGLWLDLNDGEKRSDVKLSLERVTKLSGILLEDGKAVPGARLYALRRRSADRVAETVAQATTRSDGGFDISKLPPGAYLLAVRPKPGTGHGDLSFYQNSNNASAALWVDVAAGQHVTLPVWDLNAEAVFSVSGRVLDEDGHPFSTTVQLVPGNSWDLTDLITAEASSDVRGQFAFAHVPPGEYRVEFVDFPKRADPRGTLVPTERRGFLTGRPLSATPPEGTRWATTAISVTERDVSGLELKASRGERLRVQLRFSGQEPPPSAGQLSTFAIYVRRIGGAMLDIPGARFESDATATTVELPEAEYVVGLAAAIPGWSIESLRLGSADVLGRSFRLTSTDAVLGLTDTPAGLQGIVRTNKGFPAAGAVVYVVPVDKTKWKQFGLGATLVSSTEADRDGRYAVKLVSGDYWVTAANRGSPAMSALTEDEIARLVVGAKTVTIKPGRSAAADLVTSSPRKQAKP